MGFLLRYKLIAVSKKGRTKVLLRRLNSKMGNPAKPIQSSPSLFLLNKGLEWKEKSRRADKITDKLGEKIDEKIKEAVIALSILGLPTSASCEGHADWGISAPWIEIDELSDEFSRTARELLDEFYASKRLMIISVCKLKN